MVTIETVTPRLQCKVERYVNGTFRTYMMDGKPVLRHDNGREWFNDGPSYIDCRVSGVYDNNITQESFMALLRKFKNAA
ncbi:MAG: hypothetical protein IKQ37_06935 [Bacteroidaceae bacterium]|nr:hypothetical protein [Bacteroidaceae bacterium]